MRNDLFWENACSFFLSNNLDSRPGNFFLHEKSRGQLTIGIDSDTIFIDPKDAQQNWAEAYRQIKLEQEEDRPSFFIICPDFNRAAADPDLPKIIFTQPSVEISFSAKHPNGIIQYSNSSHNHNMARSLLDAFTRAESLKAYEINHPSGDIQSYSTGWT